MSALIFRKGRTMLLIMMSACSIAGAATITSSETDLFTASATYVLHIQNNGNESNSSQFTGQTGNKNLITVSAARDFDILAPVPVGSIINGATVDFSVLAGGAVNATGPTGLNGYFPTFGVSTTNLQFNTVYVTVGLVTETFTVPNTAVPFQIVLPATFYPALQMNEAVHITWQADTQFSRSQVGDATGKYGTSQANAQHQFILSKDYSAVAGLTIDYDTPAQTPEPATFAVMGLGLASLECLRRRCRKAS